ncbi:hypothetical protein [Pedobacter helvus]|uniref:Uncharacterized protein n=1 Tax=Pedobacter helvus TaxID=2563444 RepID=A0ABW9JJD2_9SPHI|nr:hypothetical protein [Pedobacter ureilyticus]
MANIINKTSKIKLQTNSNVKDYGNHPFFVNKAKKSKAFLDEHGFPKELLEKKKVSF